MRPIVPLLAAVLAATGCGSSSLSRLGDYTFFLYTHGDEAVGSSPFHQVDLRYDVEERGCQDLGEDFAATVDGAPPVSIWGGGTEVNWWDRTSRCLPPTFTLNRPTAFDQRVVVEVIDGEDRAVVEIEDAGTHLRAEPILAPGERIHAGGIVRLALRPGFDRPTWPASGQAFVPGSAPATFPVSPPSPDGVLAIQLPAGLPPGLTRLEIVLDSSLRFTRCEGPAECAYAPGGPKVRIEETFTVDP